MNAVILRSLESRSVVELILGRDRNPMPRLKSEILAIHQARKLQVDELRGHGEIKSVGDLMCKSKRFSVARYR